MGVGVGGGGGWRRWLNTETGKQTAWLTVEEWLGIKQYCLSDVLISDKRVIVPLPLHSEVWQHFLNPDNLITLLTGYFL